MNVFGPIMTAMVTPFDEYNQLNINSLKKLIIHLLKNGTTSLVVTGTTGEAPTLNATERLRVWETAVDFASGSIPVIAGVGTNNTKTTLHNIKLAEEVGVDALLVVTPYYNKPNQQGLISHYTQLAQSTDLPIILYNVPGRTGVTFELETLAQLAQEKNIVGIKDANSNLNLISQLKEIAPSNFVFYTGDDTDYLETLKLGGAGVISVASHLAGLQMTRIFEAYKKGQLEEATRRNEILVPLYRAMFHTTNPIPVKAMLNQIGINVGSLRLPLVELNQLESAELFNEIKHLIDQEYF